MRTSQSSSNALGYGVAAGAGAGAVVVGQKIQSANRKANWALGIGVVLTGLAIVSSSDLNAAQTQAASIQAAAQAMTIDQSTSLLLGPSVNTLRNLVISLAQNAQTVAYDANWFSFNGQPAVASLASGTPTANIYAPATQAIAPAQTSSTALIVVVLAVVIVLALVAY